MSVKRNEVPEYMREYLKSLKERIYICIQELSVNNNQRNTFTEGKLSVFTCIYNDLIELYIGERDISKKVVDNKLSTGEQIYIGRDDQGYYEGVYLYTDKDRNCNVICITGDHTNLGILPKVVDRPYIRYMDCNLWTITKRGV